MESGHRFDAQTLHSFIQAVFRQMGSEEQEAKLVADHLIAANLAGHDSHGIGMIPSYVRSWSQGHLQINHHAKIVKEAGGGHARWRSPGAFGQVADTKRWRWGLRGSARYYADIPSASWLRSVTGRSSVQRRGLSLSTLLAWSVFQWSHRSTVATAALAPIRSVWFSLVKIISRCCSITPPAPSHLVKPASPGIKASPCRQVA